jgi:hypothetical protein
LIKLSELVIIKANAKEKFVNAITQMLSINRTIVKADLRGNKIELLDNVY